MIKREKQMHVGREVGVVIQATVQAQEGRMDVSMIMQI